MTGRDNPAIADLRARLCSAGGIDVLLGRDAGGIANDLLDRGRFFAGSSAIPPHRGIPLRMSQATAHGYALCGDGVWRRHTWYILDDEIIEPSSVHRLYYGYLLPAQPCISRRTSTHTSALYTERVRRTLDIGEMCLKKEEVRCKPHKSAQI